MRQAMTGSEEGHCFCHPSTVPKLFLPLHHVLQAREQMPRKLRLAVGVSGWLGTHLQADEGEVSPHFSVGVI